MFMYVCTHVAANERNVVGVHCKAGKGRTVREGDESVWSRVRVVTVSR